MRGCRRPVPVVDEACCSDEVMGPVMDKCGCTHNPACDLAGRMLAGVMDDSELESAAEECPADIQSALNAVKAACNIGDASFLVCNNEGGDTCWGSGTFRDMYDDMFSACDKYSSGIKVMKSTVEIPAKVDLNFGSSFVVPDKDASAEAFGSFVHIIRDTLEATVGGGSKVKIHSINGVAVGVEVVDARRLAAGDVEIDFAVEVELKCEVTAENTCDNAAMVALAEESYVAASEKLVEVTPEALTTNLKAATAKEVAKVEAEGGTPSSFLAEVATAAEAIKIEPVVIEVFTEDAMAEVVETVDIVEDTSTANPSAAPTDEGYPNSDDVDDDDEDDDTIPGGDASFTTSSKVTVLVGVVAAVAAYA